MRPKLMMCYAVLLFAAGCSKKARDKGVQDNDITIQAGRLEKGVYSFKARITPSQLLITDKGKNLDVNMLYKMDSAFFIQNGRQKIYPGIIQPIADGVKGSFEYMILFDDGLQIKDDSIRLVYADKYLNRKKYTITFEK